MDEYENYGYGMMPMGYGGGRRPRSPKIRLETDRRLWKMIVFGILTGGIYSSYMYFKMQEDLNLMECKKDGERTTNFYLATIFDTLTLGIYMFIWEHRFAKRIGNALDRRGIDYKFSAGTYWGWNIFGLLLLGLGPWIYLYKLIKAMNYLSEDFNEVG